MLLSSTPLTAAAREAVTHGELRASNPTLRVQTWEEKDTTWLIFTGAI